MERYLVDKLGHAPSTIGPVELDSVARKLGVVSIQYANIPCDAMLMPQGKTPPKLVLSRAASAERRKFSLAHEIGHAVIHRLLPRTTSLAKRSLFTQPGNVIEERLCDAIAARLLLPTSMCRKFLGEHELSPGLIRNVARKFGVSVSCAAIRVRELSGIDFAMLSFASFRSEAIALFDRVFANFERGRLRLRFGQQFEPPSLVARAIEQGNVQNGWEWFSEGNRKRRLFVQCDGTTSDRFGALVFAVISRCEFDRRSLCAAA